MKRLNIRFFDEYKELDNLCIDLFGEVDGKRGVTLYIDQMSKNAKLGKAEIDEWESDYQNLKDVRHTRNQLAHSHDSFSDKVCTKDQLDFVLSFKKKLQKGRDPLSILQNRTAKKKTRRRFNALMILLLLGLVIAFFIKLFILK